jgi:septal ring factor EnvC (AmiA/AmiB activator)
MAIMSPACFGSGTSRWLAAGVIGLYLAAPAAAQTTGSIPDPHQSTLTELDRVTREIKLSDETVSRLTASIATLRKDHATITAALIQSAKTERKLAEDIEAITARLDKEKAAEAVIRKSLWERRDVLAEVLGGLERMGLNPPPAILVSPQDALSSVRSAILLGAVVPQLRQETDILLGDLRELARISASIQAERDRLASTATEMSAEKQKLTMLLNEKERLGAERQAEMEAERQRAAELARKAGSLKELVATLEQEAARKREAESLARAEEANRLQREEELAAMPIPDENRLTGGAPFSTLHGKLTVPAAGKRIKRFGGKDGFGGAYQGDTVATQSGSIVTSPVDADILYAGPFRSYKQLLILDAGDDYLVVLAGMGRITVGQGQFVMAGEPVGAMNDTRLADAAGDKSGNAVPELYVEFRKDGKPVDPDPWWSGR